MADEKIKTSIIIPACNEEQGLQILLPELNKSFPEAEILVVNDGSTDRTLDICRQNNVKVINHPHQMGNGAAVKTGARSAGGDIFVFMDADGQHRVSDLEALITKFNQGYDMVVGARPVNNHVNFIRKAGNVIYNRLASWITGHRIEDLTSGYRVVWAEKFREFLYMLPNGFSYPTTITMAFFRSGYSVGYCTINTGAAMGNSHIRIIRDGIKFVLIIFRVGTLYSPLKIFFPASVMFFLLGISNYIYTYVTASRFTNMSTFMLITSIVVFLIGLLSEQITSLMYQHNN